VILAVAGAIGTPGAQALAGGASPSTPATTPTFPVPASAKVPPTSTATTPTTPATGGTATPPTTTYTPQSTPPAGNVPTTTIPSYTTPTARTITTPASAHATKSSKLSTPAIALAILGALIALLCLAWAIARAQAYEPHWARSLRHSLAEGGFRASATWAEFSDWARLGK
jgi:hypothetical protein